MHQPRPEPLSSKSPYRLSYRFMHAQLSCQQKSTTSRLYSVSVLFFIRKMETVNKRSLLLTAFFLREVLNPVRSWPDFVFSILLSFYPRHKERLSWIQSVFLSSSNFVDPMSPPHHISLQFLYLSFKWFLWQFFLARSQRKVAKILPLASPCLSVYCHLTTRQALHGFQWYSSCRTWWHTRRNQISSFPETDESI